LPHISAGWIVSGAADPAGSRKDHGRNFCAFGIGDIAAAKIAAAADGISRAAARAVAIPIAGIVNPAVETEAAVVTVAVTAKEAASPTTAAVESRDAAAVKTAMKTVMKTAPSPRAAMKAAAVKAAAMKAAAVKALAVKTAAEAASRVSGSGE
jgi:hypothetical protein